MAVYVLIDETRKCCKIGYSKDTNTLRNRIKALQTASPFKLDVLCVNEALNESDERRFHAQVTDYCTGGGREWFDLTNHNVKAVVEQISQMQCSKPLTCRDDRRRSDDISLEERANPSICSCDCEDEDFSSIHECCSYCVWNQSQFSDLSFGEFQSMVLELSNCKWQPPMSSRFGAYISDHCKPATSKDLVDYLLDDGHGISDSGFASRASAVCISHGLFEEILPEDCYDAVYPIPYIFDKGIVVVIPGEFSECMESAESLYLTYFWDIDAAGSQLHVCCINSAREVRFVPLRLAYDFKSYVTDG